MRVDRAAPPCQERSAGGSVHYERGRSAFVGNLPFDVEVRSLPLHVLPGCMLLRQNADPYSSFHSWETWPAICTLHGLEHCAGSAGGH